jgi:hypothetical protein
MSAHAPKERLSHLLELAAQGGEARQALLGELADLLLDWPSDYAAAMRSPFEALLERAARDADRPTRAALAARFVGHDGLALELLNEFFAVAPPALKSSILTRNETAEAPDDAPRADAADPMALIHAARAGAGLAEALARYLGVNASLADEILEDDSAQSLAVACRGAHLNRATFSALAVLAATDRSAIPDRLAVYETIPQGAAKGLLSFWRMRHGAPAQARAAE